MLHQYWALALPATCWAISSSSSVVAVGGHGGGGGDDGDRNLSLIQKRVDPGHVALLYSFGVSGSHVIRLEGVQGGGADTFQGNSNNNSVEFMVLPSSSADFEGLEEAEAASSAGETYLVLILQQCRTRDNSQFVLRIFRHCCYCAVQQSKRNHGSGTACTTSSEQWCVEGSNFCGGRGKFDSIRCLFGNAAEIGRWCVL